MDSAAERFTNQTWSYSVPGKHATEGLVLFTADGRMIQWMKVTDLPQKEGWMNLFYGIEGPQSMCIRTKQGRKLWTRTFAFHGKWFVVSSDVISWLLEPVAPEDVPDWFTAVVDLCKKG